MIASARGVIALCAIAVILAVFAIVDGRPAAIEDRAIAPGFTTVDTLAWSRPGAPDYATKAGPYTDGVIAALRGGTWHRRAEAARAGKISTTLHAGGVTIGIGEPLAGTEQQWIVRGDDALLVDAWVARALSPAPWQLRDKHVFPDVDGDLSIGDRTFVGHPRRLAGDGPFVDAARIAAFEQALAALEIVGAARSPGASLEDRFSVDSHRATACAAACDAAQTAIRIDDERDPVCVTKSAWDAVLATAAALRGDIVERRLSPIVPSSIELPDGPLPLAHTDAVDELLATLASPAEPAPPGESRGRPIILERDAVTVSLVLMPPDRAIRSDHTGWRVGAGAFAILSRPLAAYRDRTLWREDPLSITKLSLDGIDYTRGTVIGEWRKANGPSTPMPEIEALVAALASPKSLGDTALPTPRRGRIDAPMGAAHTFELGSKTPSGCPLRADGRAVLIVCP